MDGGLVTIGEPGERVARGPGVGVVLIVCG